MNNYDILLNKEEHSYNFDIKWGDILLVNLGKGEGSEQEGIRPCLVLQNNMGNRYSPTIIVAAISSQMKDFPTHKNITNYKEVGLNMPSQICLEQIRTISKTRVKAKIGSLDKNTLYSLECIVLNSLGFKNTKHIAI